MDILSIPDNFAELYNACFGEEWTYGPLSESTQFLQHNEGWAVVEWTGNRAFILAAGVMPGVRQRGVATESFRLAVNYLKERASDVQYVTKRHNIAPQILALKNGFIIHGFIAGEKNDMQIIWRLA